MAQEKKINPDEFKTYIATEQNLVDDLFMGTAAKTFFESPQWGDSQFNPFNKDDLYVKDSEYKIYEDMINDDQVSVALRIKKDCVIGSGSLGPLYSIC